MTSVSGSATSTSTTTTSTIDQTTQAWDTKISDQQQSDTLLAQAQELMAQFKTATNIGQDNNLAQGQDGWVAWAQEYHPDQTALLNQALTAYNQGTALNQGETVTQLQSDKTTALAAVMATTTAGQQMLDEAQQAGSALAVDLSGMSVEQMVLAVFGAANQSREELATTNMDSLNKTSQNVGTLTSLMNSVRSLIPTSTDTTTKAELSQGVVDQLKALGVSVPDGSESSDGQGIDLTEDQFNSLVQNCQGTIDTLNSTTTTQLQDLTKVNDDMSEDMQAMSKTIDDTHQMDMGILQN